MHDFFNRQKVKEREQKCVLRVCYFSCFGVFFFCFVFVFVFVFLCVCVCVCVCVFKCVCARSYVRKRKREKVRETEGDGKTEERENNMRTARSCHSRVVFTLNGIILGRILLLRRRRSPLLCKESRKQMRRNRHFSH